jgi:Double-GTPase 2
MAHSCSNKDCTVAATGKCVLLHTPLETCPHYTAVPEGLEKSKETKQDTFEAVPETGEGGRRFYSGFELGTSDAAEIMGAKYGTLIAVLGQYDVGKTCFLASLYLMTACGVGLPGLAFAGSLTLNGFEARARRLRQWKGGALPTQLADHTVLADERTPAIMHLALKETQGEKRRFDLLITDLPGEWSTDLVKDVGTAQRFAFLGRADGIVVTLDGPMLAGTERHAAAYDAKLLLTRLSQTLNVDRSTPLVLMVTKSDELGMELPPIVAEIADHATRGGFAPKIIPIAAISRAPEAVPSGTGVPDVIEYILARTPPTTVPVPPVSPPASTRNFAQIRG